MQPDLMERFNGWGLYLIARMVKATCRYQISGRQHLEEAISSGKAIILAGWHGMTMMAAPWIMRHHDMSRYLIIMPDDWRGMTLSVFTRKLGATPFPMHLEGDSSLGTGRQLVKLIEKIKKGYYGYITPDGPDGPAYVIKPGLTYIAFKTSALILPFGGYARHCYRVNRWDQYVIPYPLSRISLVIGQPYHLDTDLQDLEHANQELTDIIHRITMQAGANYYVDRNQSDPYK